MKVPIVALPLDVIVSQMIHVHVHVISIGNLNVIDTFKQKIVFFVLVDTNPSGLANKLTDNIFHPSNQTKPWGCKQT